MDPHFGRQKYGGQAGDSASGSQQLDCGSEQEAATNVASSGPTTTTTTGKQKIGKLSGNHSHHDVLSSIMELLIKDSKEGTSFAKLGLTTATNSSNSSSGANDSLVAAAATNLTSTFFWPSQDGHPKLDSGDSEIIQSGLQFSSEIAKLKLEQVENSSYQLEALDEKWQSFLIVLYSFTALTSFVLNVLTVIVLLRCRRSELREYLINLSLSDLLMSLFSIPFTYTEYMLGRWVFSAFLCPLVRFVVTLSVFVSAATMTVIGVNRHLAIMDPFGRTLMSRLRNLPVRKNYVIASIWLIGIVISLPEFLMFSVQSFCFNNKSYYDCRSLWNESVENSYAVFIYLCTFAIPLSLLSYLYGCIMIKLWRRRLPGEADANRDLAIQQMCVKTIKMLCVVVIMFAISWLPLQTFSMVVYLFPELRQNFQYKSFEYNLFIGTYFACHWLSIAHSCLNPLIYCFMNDKFLDDLREIVFKRLWFGWGGGGVGSSAANGHSATLRLVSQHQKLQHTCTAATTIIHNNNLNMNNTASNFKQTTSNNDHHQFNPSSGAAVTPVKSPLWVRSRLLCGSPRRQATRRRSKRGRKQSHSPVSSWALVGDAAGVLVDASRTSIQAAGANNHRRVSSTHRRQSTDEDRAAGSPIPEEAPLVAAARLSEHLLADDHLTTIEMALWVKGDSDDGEFVLDRGPADEV